MRQWDLWALFSEEVSLVCDLREVGPLVAQTVVLDNKSAKKIKNRLHDNVTCVARGNHSDSSDCNLQFPARDDGKNENINQSRTRSGGDPSPGSISPHLVGSTAINWPPKKENVK
jgi:hypothetical protein